MSYVALDIGGSNVRFAFANEWNSNILEYHKKPFIRSGNPYTEVEENICNIVDVITDRVEGLGISLAAVMDRSCKKVKTWPNNPSWNQYELVKHLSSRYKIPIIIEDDANCGAFGEYHILEKNIKNFAYISIGTGIGCGLILNGSLFTGENGFAGEVGHMYVGGNNLCTCGNYGCLQSIASGPAILKHYNSTANTNIHSLEIVNTLYTQGDPVAVTCISEAIEHISCSILNLTMCLDISQFVIGGGVSKLGVKFLSDMQAAVNKKLVNFGRQVTISSSKLDEFSGVYGAIQLLSIEIKKGGQRWKK